MATAKRYNAFLVNILLRWLPRDGTAIDFGAGSGTLATALRERGLQIRCVEPDEKLRRYLQEMGFAAYSTVEAVPEPQVNAIYSFNVLEHIADDAATLHTLYEQIQSEGRIVLFVPAFQLLFSSMDRHVGHFRRYRKKHLTKMVSDAGFQIEHARYADCLGFFAALIYRLMGNADGRIDRHALMTYDRVIFPISRLLDHLTGWLFGKNLLVVARKPRTNYAAGKPD